MTAGTALPSRGPALSTPGRALVVAAVVLFVGSALLQAASPEGRSDPVASIENGGPRGLLLLALALRDSGARVTRVKSDDELEAALATPGQPPATILIPPPEQAVFSAAEAQRLLAAVDAGHRLFIACDPKKERRKRMASLFGALGLRCQDQGDGSAPPTTVSLALSTAKTAAKTSAAETPARLFVRDGGRLSVDEAAPGVIPLGADDADAVVAAVVVKGAGDVVVFGSTTPLSNDGLAEADNVGVVFGLLAPQGPRGAHVIVDERHHQTRGTLALQAASARGAGPMTALICALLLIPLTLLGLGPRRGELLASGGPELPAASARVRGLAALMAAAGPAHPTSTHSRPGETGVK